MNPKFLPKTHITLELLEQIISYFNGQPTWYWYPHTCWQIR